MDIYIERERERIIYQEKSASGGLDYEIRHVSDDVGIKTDVEEHVDYVEDFFSRVL